MSDMDSVHLWIPGKPRAKGRHRTTRTGRTYTPDATVSAEQAVQVEWIAAGRPSLGDAPVKLELIALFSRPAGHWRTNGELSAAGLRAQWPTQKPDADNLGKLVADSLNARAWHDDAQIVVLTVVKRWAAMHQGPGVKVIATVAA